MSQTLPSMVPMAVARLNKESAINNPNLSTQSPVDTTPIALRHKGRSVLICWPKTYEDVLFFAREAFPTLPADDGMIYLETTIRVEKKGFEVKPERTLITPSGWASVTIHGSGAVRTIDILTHGEKSWGLLEAWKVGWNELKRSVGRSEPDSPPEKRV